MTAEDNDLAEDSPVLVAVMNNRRDFGIARDQGWYRIPRERAPSRIGADYLAFYQTKSFGEERWAIHYYAPIRHFRIAPRGDLLPEEPDHPRVDELYYKIEIGPLQHLPRPIPSRRLRRITFIPTTLDRLLHAEEINDLWIGGVVEERLWRAFKENGIDAERKYPLKEEDVAYRIDFALLCKHGNVAILLEGEPSVENVHIIREQPRIGDYDLAAHGWTILRVPYSEIIDSLPGCLDSILTAIARHGGPSAHPQR